MSKISIFTIGYEGSILNDFVATLVEVGIQQIIDIRELPVSRRAGFSKSAISAALNSSGIDYLHIRELGDPKDGRNAARRGDYKEFRRIYSKHLRSIEAQSGLETVLTVAKKNLSCLLCYERDPANCHRSLVTEALDGKADITVRHLGVQPIATRGHRIYGGSKRHTSAVRRD